MKTFNLWLLVICGVMTFGCSDETLEAVTPEATTAVTQDDASLRTTGTVNYTSQEDLADFFSTYGFIEPDDVYLNRTASKSGYTSVYGFNIPSGNQQIGFKWNADDTQTEKWYPQGVGGFNWNGRRYVVVSWYAKDYYKGSRVSLVDITDMSNIKYRHILLVQSRTTQTSSEYTQLETFRPVDIHAGGVACHNGKLFVASTNLGIRVFDLTKIIEVNYTDAGTICGWDESSNQIYALGYRYILPQVGYYSISEGDPFSCLSLSYGINDSDLRLTTGQYLTSGSPVINSFYVDSNGDIDTSIAPEIIAPEDKYEGPVYRVQGAFTRYGKSFLIHTGNSSYEGSTARLSKAVEGSTTVRYRWPHGAEDLYYESSTGLLWNVTEYPTSKYGTDNRCVFAVKLEDYW
ncbi:hypothetical protein V6R21_28140 [Limibacter armeniacum]|uniref:hypothetical protein n=1 Tax=Limibacter armeniacum TaxID=466084 RepID=UPI002FE62372